MAQINPFVTVGYKGTERTLHHIGSRNGLREKGCWCCSFSDTWSAGLCLPYAYLPIAVQAEAGSHGHSIWWKSAEHNVKCLSASPSAYSEHRAGGCKSVARTRLHNLWRWKLLSVWQISTALVEQMSWTQRKFVGYYFVEKWKLCTFAHIIEYTVPEGMKML